MTEALIEPAPSSEVTGGERRFERGERIHTENSYKYTRQSFATLLERAGFATTRTWTDDDQWFAVIHARAIPD